MHSTTESKRLIGPAFSTLTPPRLPLALFTGVLALLSAAMPARGAQTLVARRSGSWRYAKGTQEASNPVESWREPDYSDSGWSSGSAPFGYGDGTHESADCNTVLGDMQNNYTTFFMRKHFTVADAPSVTDLQVAVDYDDGLIVWINGDKVLSLNAPDNVPLYNSTASGSHEAGVYETHQLPDPDDYLVTGDNVIAVQGFNLTADSSDFKLDVELTSYRQVADTKFSHDRGFYEAPFTVTIATATDGATIRYTTDGSEPTASHGASAVNSAQVTIDRTTCLRAAAFKQDHEPTNVDTHTYIFLASVLNQTRPAGYPSVWEYNYRRRTSDPYETIAGDYAMDPDVVSAYGATIDNDMQAVPTLSIVADKDGLFGATDGIYTHPLKSGLDWERACSAEWIDPSGGEDGFQINCALRIAGAGSREWCYNKKKSWSIRFKSEYGPGRLKYKLYENCPTESFNYLRLRAGLNDSWPLHPKHAQYLVENFVARTQSAMGWEQAYSRWAHLYINGLYWGLYGVTVRPDAAFGESVHGGDEEDYDAYTGEYWYRQEPEPYEPRVYPRFTDGNDTAYKAMKAIRDKNLSYLSNYNQMKGYLDIAQYADYMLANFYNGTSDWAPKPDSSGEGKNFRALRWSRNRGLGSPQFQYFSWDAEENLTIHEDWNRDITDNLGIDRLQTNLRASKEYTLLFADRVYKHLFNGGALTPAETTARYAACAAEIDRAIVGESARWGDQKVQYQMQSSDEWAEYWAEKGGNADNYPAITRDEDWAPFRDTLLAGHYQNRTGILFNQLKAEGLYPLIDAPEFHRHGGAIASGFKLTMTNPNGSTGTIFYKLDGTDPRAEGGAKASGATQYTGAPALVRTSCVKARVYKSNGTWSAAHEATYNYTAHYPLIRITEIHYHPLAGSELEFVEIQNVSGSTTVGLSEMRFEKGIDYTFEPGAELGPGKFAVLVRNAAAFSARHPTVQGSADVEIFGSYRGKLDNGGERLTLADNEGRTVATVRYNDKAPWPETTDGDGFSLVYAGTDDDQDDAAKWRASNLIDGSPGYDEGAPYRVVVNEALTHTDLPQVDTIELHNEGSAGVNIGGWYLSDTTDNYKLYQLPSHLLGAGGYKLYDENELGFQLDSHGDQVYLTKWDADDNLLYLAEARFGGAANGRAFGRHVKSDGDADFVAQSTGDTLGAANAYPLVGPVVISELMYHPVDGDDEFIELMNISSATVQLYDPANPANTWRLDGAVEFTFPQGITLSPGEILLVIGGDSASAFRTKYGVPAHVQILKQYAGLLSNGGESVKLWRPGEPDAKGIPWILVDRVKYNDNSPWPESPDGDGPSLERIAPALYGNDPANWAASESNGGTPGEANSGMLVAKTAGWRYHDEGDNLGTGWRNAGYDDSAWEDGNAPLGYPDTNPDIDTETDFGDDPGNKPITTYFRTRFMLDSDPDDVTTLRLRARYDDGYVAYLNGQEVARAGMPSGTINYNTLASGSGSGTSYEEKDILGHKHRLVQGLNVLAVEVHQSSPSSSDIFMDMDLRHTAVQAPTPPAPPDNVTAAPLSTTQIRLSWNDNSNNEDQFKVRWGLTAGSQPNEVYLGANTTSWTHSGLSANTPYYYLVRAQNAVGNSVYVGPVSATTHDVAPAIAVSTTSIEVTCVEGTDAASETFQVWNNGGSTLAYQISDNTGKFSVSPTTGSSADSGDKQTHTITFTTSGEPVGTHDRQIAVADDGSGAANGPITIDVRIVVTSGVPAPPENVTVTPLSATEISVSWQDNSDNEDGFKVDRRQSGTGDWVRVQTTGPGVESFTDSGLPADTTFYYKVKAYNAVGNSAYSSVAGATTQPALIPAIAVSTTAIEVSCYEGEQADDVTFHVWNSGTGTLLYDVVETSSTMEIAPTGGSSTGSADVQIHTVSFPRDDLPAGTYDKTITVADNGSGASNGPLTIDVTITVNTPPQTGPFTAYNDLAWDSAQSAVNITTYTRNQNGLLVDHASGQPIAAQVAVNGGGAGPYTDQGGDATSGTDADGVFGGKVDCTGLISYGTDLVLSFTELDPALRYEIVLFGNRDNTAYSDRLTTVTISDVDAFENRSTAGATFSGTADASTETSNGNNTGNGYVARFANVDPGADGTATITVSDSVPKFYVNAFMLRGHEPSQSTAIIPRGAIWTYHKGSTEASSPAEAWRQPAFDDSGWAVGTAPIGYGDGPYGTTLTDMRNVYATVMLRHVFTLSSPARITSLDLWTLYDDGFVVWINGTEVARHNVDGAPGTLNTYKDTANAGVSDGTEWNLTLSGPALPVLLQTNVLAIQVFNVGVDSSDLTVDLELTGQLDTPPGTDTDNDGMPDDWEQAFLSDQSDPSDRSDTADPDNDGLSNLAEWIAGTDPDDETGYLKLETRLQGGQLVVAFTSTVATGAGYTGLTRHYAIQQRTGSFLGGWSDLPGYEDITATGADITYPNAGADPAAHYRLKVWLE